MNDGRKKFRPMKFSEATEAEQVAMLIWYARSLSQTLRDQAEFSETDAERQTKMFAAYEVDRVWEDWPGKWTGWTNKHKPEWAAQFEGPGEAAE